ncbi:MAG: class I SAM-dependent methyltransferase [Pseudomonadales bacterium]
MANNSIANTGLTASNQSLRRHHMYSVLLSRVLKKLQVGLLTVTNPGETLEYGSKFSRTDLTAHINILNQGAYRRIVRGGVLGAAESYILGEWSSPDLVAVVRVFSANMIVMSELDDGGAVSKAIANAWQLIRNKNTIDGSKRNIVAHYDLSNEFFASFLDKGMMYSSAMFPYPNASLEEAADYKLRHICERLQLTESDHLLEIGTGWGGLACYAAKHYGCRVTSTTISNEQLSLARQRVKDEGVEDKVTLLDLDYRKLEGTYDKLVSVEMIEAVGHEYYKEYFAACSRLLKEDGLMLLQAITIADDRYESAKNSVDFIKKYIFPGGCLPCNSIIAHHMAKDGNMMIVGLEDIGLHYADTLAHWRQRFSAAKNGLAAQGFDQRFERMWDFYLMYCEGGFRERLISAVQVLAAKPGRREAPAVNMFVEGSS